MSRSIRVANRRFEMMINYREVKQQPMYKEDLNYMNEVISVVAYNPSTQEIEALRSSKLEKI